MRRRLLAASSISALATVAILLVPSAAAANHAWADYHWARTSNPFTVKLADLVDSTWDSYLAKASSDWSQSTVLDTTIVAGSGNPRTCKGTTGIVTVCNAAYGQNGWLGVASINIDSNHHITKGTVKLNDTYFALAQYNTPSWRQLVACQEVGHTFGLDHQDTNFNNTNLGTCMDYTSNPDGPPANTSPNKHDYDELVTIYSHTDSYTTVGAALPATAAAADDASSWGRLVAGSASQGTGVFVRDLEHGEYMVTFVIWA